MNRKFTLGKKERLKSRKALDQLFNTGKSFTCPPFRVIYSPAPGGLQFATGVSTRNFKKAVDRNRIKRQIREAYRLNNLPLKEKLGADQQGLHVFFTYTAREQTAYVQIEKAVQKAIGKLLNMIHENTVAGT